MEYKRWFMLNWRAFSIAVEMILIGSLIIFEVAISTLFWSSHREH